MKLHPTSFLLVPSTVSLCYLIPLAGSVVRPFFVHSLQIRSDADLQAIMPAATRFVADQAWLFAAAGVGVGVIGLAWSLALRTASGRLSVIALCVQGIVAWAVFFCLFCSAFTRFSLRTGDVFVWDYFLTVGAGVSRSLLLPFSYRFVLRSSHLVRTPVPDHPSAANGGRNVCSGRLAFSPVVAELGSLGVLPCVCPPSAV